MAKLDIHNFEGQYASVQARVRESPISARNKALIFAYRDACLLNGVCGKVRLIRVFWTLRDFALRLGKDFDQATKDDLKALASTLHDGSLKPTSIGTYKAILKRFMGFVLRPDEFPNLEAQPPQIAWLHSHVRKRDQPRLERSSLLLPSDIERLIRAAHGARDRALIGTMWEAGWRIGEGGNLQIKDVLKHQHGFTLGLTGKTGHRDILVVSAAPYLAQWLNIHPFADNPEAPVWILEQFSPTPKHASYTSLKAIIHRLLARAGMKKRVYPHLFRHSRVTHLLAMGIMNEQQAKAYFGWTPDSDSIATYAHLCDQDANNAILRENGLAPLTPATATLQPRQCPLCKERNAATATFCTRCTTILDPQRTYETTAHAASTNATVLRLLELLVKQHGIDGAADAIHNAGLGHALKELATTRQPTA